MTKIQLRNRPLDTVFDLLGADENALTYALGYCLGNVPSLLIAVAAQLGKIAPGDDSTVHLQKHDVRNGITDIEIVEPGKVAWILEAKVGFAPPGSDQLEKYARRLNQISLEAVDKLLVVLAQSDRRDLWLKATVPDEVSGIPVKVVSWRQIRTCIERAIDPADNSQRRLLRQLNQFIGKVLGMQFATSNEAYVVSLSPDTFGGTTTFIEVVEKFRKYFHPIGSGWPINPPNYMAFRWNGKLQSIHHVDHYEVITDFHSFFADVPEKTHDAHFLYHLGPAITPTHEVRTGNIFRAARVWVHLDLLLTSETISDARLKTQQRLETSGVG